MINTKINIDFSQVTKGFDNLEKDVKDIGKDIDKSFDGSSVKNLSNVVDKEFKQIANKSKGLFATLKESLNLGSILNVASGQLVANAISGIGSALGDLYDKGRQADAIATQLENGFRLAGLSGEELGKQMAETTDYARKLGFELGVAPQRLKELSATAGALGGATGKMNKDLTKLAVGMEAATNGAISGENAIKIFSRGIADPENAEAIDKLKKQFPQLGDALLSAGSPSEKLQAALGALSGTFQTMKNDLSDAGDRFANFKNQFDEGMQAFAGNVLGAFNTDKLIEFFSEMGDGVDIFKTLEDAGTALGEAMTDLLVNTLSFFKRAYENIKPLIASIGTLFSSIGNLLDELFGGQGKGLTGVISLLQDLYLIIQKVISMALTMFVNILNQVVQTIINVVKWFKELYQNSQFVKNVVDAVVGTFKEFAKTLGSIITKVLEFFGILGKDTKVTKKVEVTAELEINKSVEELNSEINNLIQKNNSFELNKKQFVDTQNAIKRNIQLRLQEGKITQAENDKLLKQLNAIELAKKPKETKSKTEKELTELQKLQEEYNKLLDKTETLARKNDFGDVYKNNVSKLQELKNKIEEFDKAKLKVQIELDKDYKEKLQKEINDKEISLMKDSKEKELKIIDAKYKEDLKKYKDNEKMKELSYVEFKNKETEINDKYLKIALDKENELLKKKLELLPDGFDKEIKLLELRYNEELQLYKDNEEIKTLLTDKFAKDRLEIEKKYNKKFDYAKLFSDSLNKIDYSKIFKKKEIEFDKSLDNDRQNLLSSLQKNELSYEDYANRLNEIDSQRNETAKQKNSEFVNDLNNTLSTSFVNLNQVMNDSLNSGIAKISETQLTSEDFTKNISDNIASAMLVIGSATADMAVSGQNLLKSLAISTIKTARAMFNAYLAPLLAKEVLSKNVAGIATFGAYSILGNSFLSIAEGLVAGFKDGVIDLQGAGTGRSDSISARLSKGESVINARSTKENKRYLEFINNGGKIGDLISMNNAISTRRMENLLMTNNNLLQNKNLVSNVNVNNQIQVANSGISVKFKR